MTILSGLVALLNRLLGHAANATVGWAAILLYGRVPQARHTALSLIALASLLWWLAIIGILVPALGDAVASSIPRQVPVPIGWFRLALIGAVIVIPIVVGVTLPVAARETRPTGLSALAAILRGYPITAVLGATIAILAAIGVVRQGRALQHGWDDRSIPLMVKPGRYGAVADDIEDALRTAGLPVRRKAAPSAVEAAPRLLALVSGHAHDDDVPRRLVAFGTDDLDVLLYPSQVLIVGKDELVACAQAAIARRLAFADVYLTTGEESEKVEDRLVAIAKRAKPTAADFRSIDESLSHLAIPYDDWETIYRLRLQVEHERRMPGATNPADGS